MEGLRLVRPSKDMEKDILEYKQEFLDFGESRINGSCGITFFEKFDDWLYTVTSIVEDKLSRDNVHASTFFTIRESDNKVIGSIQLRHSLTDELSEHTGHIGYAIRPTERRKGYGKEQLMLVLNEAKKMGIEKVMISCDADNVASAKIIVACGGVLTTEKQYQGYLHQIYWIDLN